MDFLAPIWNLIFIQPLVNIIVLMYSILGHNFVLATLVATVLVQLVTWPLTQQSLNSSKKMTALQSSDKWKDAQKKYKNDKEAMAKVTMEMYREAGINPAAGCLPTLIQMPLLIAFYQSINTLLAVNPESLLDLTSHLYRGVPFIAELAKQTIPLESQFLWMNLAYPDPFYLMPLLVAGSTWFSQKTLSMPSADPQQSAMNNQMQLMMPVMFGFFALNFPSGLAAYWIISSLVRMVFQGFAQGWSTVLPRMVGGGRAVPAPRKPAPSAPAKDDNDDEPADPPRPRQIAPVPPSGNGQSRRKNRRSRR
ncbi:MAG: membrane protein insertase YidC [Chloroflexi bacterium]|nr:membrane protein insertase YidC [Chloroflexota bacterium]